MPVRLGAAEDTLIAQLNSVGATAEAERMTVAGLPTRRVESYHYTDLKTLLKAVPPLAQAANEASAPALRVPGAYRLMIANGVVQSATTAPAGVIVGKAEGGVLSTRDDVLVHLNGALAKESLTLTLENSVDPVIQIDRRAEGEAAHVADSLKIFVADNASAVILETFSGSDAAHVGNHATYLAVGKNAVVTHITVDLSAKATTHFATNEYQLAEGAKLRTLTIHAGAALSRSQVFARFAGEGAHADFTGLNLVEDGQHNDITIDIRHGVANTTSQEMYKQIARGRSKAVFQGKIVVDRDAQKVDAKMMMQGLMLSDEAEILSKPELEIYADDVVCGHGSTCGELDEDSMFYLMSRGIPKAEAETMLVRGFIEEVLDPIEDEELNEALTGIVDGWLLGA
ncbi:Fe-S cluster assembly protein SufD [Devosia sp. J2-20]|jgi:Fe-S cluster assembly protein SufD|nr:MULTISPECIES: Fe-S cluster assembly protein SufD [Devosia]WDQ98690.1 Fe-S cluster assembly protein SufD [Devosia sp. J2-20]|tara:strand:- start:13165 stop:14361 length:1197 start_codon:yes stop_codon:yes gene_type:complete